MSNTDNLKDFFLSVIDGIAEDAASKQQKIPLSQIRFEVDDWRGALFAPHYFPYLIYGRGPGKQPPPEAMTKFVEDNPEILASAREQFENITAKQLGFLIGRKIGREGTDIYIGKRPGIDLLGVLEKNMPDLLERIAETEALKVATELHNKLQPNAK